MSKIMWAFIAPETLLLFLLILSTGLLWTRYNKQGRILIGATVFIITLVSILPFSSWILRPLEDRFPIPKELPSVVDGIIVLAGAENVSVTAARGQPSVYDGGERLTTFAWLAHTYPDAVLLFSGGSGSLTEQKYKPADTARKIFNQIGLDSGRVTFESDSKNTEENALNSYALIKPIPGQRWILVTSAFHMPRAVGLFRKAGWNIIPYPVDFQTTKHFSLKFDFREIGRLSLGIREWLGLFVYRAIGATLTLLPGP
ncbi:MAG: YdcF family protein [Nitrospina sp.]|nr:YdcF family protein [Nitrospina sp.]MBT6600974.1 YdcF family protein [Nitrospina sp.]